MIDGHTLFWIATMAGGLGTVLSIASLLAR